MNKLPDAVSGSVVCDVDVAINFFHAKERNDDELAILAWFSCWRGSYNSWGEENMSWVFSHEQQPGEEGREEKGGHPDSTL